MPVHSIHIFDRKGKTLYTRKFAKDLSAGGGDIPAPFETATSLSASELENLSEQRKLVFGMIFSLREVVGSLSPPPSFQQQQQQPTSPTKGGTSGAGMGTNNALDNIDDIGLHSVQTGASTLHSYETPSGIRIAMYLAAPATKDGIVPLTSGASGLGTDQINNQQQQSNSASNTNQTQQMMIIRQQQRLKSIRLALKYIYHELWIQCVTRSPLYKPTEPNVQDTNFGQRLEQFLKAQPWYLN